MPIRHLCFALASCLLTPMARGDDIPKPVGADKVKVAIVNVKESVRLKPSEKVKLKVEVLQPDKASAPNFVFVYLGQAVGKSLYSSYITKRVGTATDPLSYELEFTMLGKLDDCILFAEAVYVEPPPPDAKEAKITRVESKKAKVRMD